MKTQTLDAHAFAEAQKHTYMQKNKNKNMVLVVRCCPGSFSIQSIIDYFCFLSKLLQMS